MKGYEIDFGEGSEIKEVGAALKSKVASGFGIVTVLQVLLGHTSSYNPYIVLFYSSCD